jgi:hypothetical protein
MWTGSLVMKTLRVEDDGFEARLAWDWLKLQEAQRNTRATDTLAEDKSAE